MLYDLIQGQVTEVWKLRKWPFHCLSYLPVCM